MKYLYEVTAKYLDGSFPEQITHIVECGSTRRAAVLANRVVRQEHRRRGGCGRLPRIEKIVEVGTVDARD